MASAVLAERQNNAELAWQMQMQRFGGGTAIGNEIASGTRAGPRTTGPQPTWVFTRVNQHVLTAFERWWREGPDHPDAPIPVARRHPFTLAHDAFQAGVAFARGQLISVQDGAS